MFMGSEGRGRNEDESQVSDSHQCTLPSFYQADEAIRKSSPQLSFVYL